ncbi:MAG: hypothetical protein AAF329_00280 [Cyanobacteria bacterium P01_A01_bin.17]
MIWGTQKTTDLWMLSGIGSAGEQLFYEENNSASSAARRSKGSHLKPSQTGQKPPKD